MQKLITILLSTLLLLGCTDNSVNKLLEQAKAEIESGDYEQAFNSLKLTLDKDSNNIEAKKLYSIIEDFQNIKVLVDENKMQEAYKILSDIDSNYSNYAIKNDIDELKDQIDNYTAEVRKIAFHLSEAEKLFNSSKYEECKIYLKSNISTLKENTTDLNLFETEEQKTKANDLYKKCEEEIIKIEEAKKLEETKKAEEVKNTQETKKTEETTAKSEPQKGASTSSSSATPSTSTKEVTKNESPTKTPPKDATKDESTNPYTNGKKNINGFSYTIRDESHWQTSLYYTLAKAGLNKVIIYDYTVPQTGAKGKVATALYYTDDNEYFFNYRSVFGNNNHGSQYFGEYQGKSVHYLYDYEIK